MPGNSAVTITAATFFTSIRPAAAADRSKSDKLPSIPTPILLNMARIVCTVNTSVPSPVPCKPTTIP